MMEKRTTFEPSALTSTYDVLPNEFIRWQRDSRVSLLRTVATGGAGSVRTMSSHLPVLATTSEDGSINLATRGIGLLPKATRIDYSTRVLRTAIERAGTFPARETITDRLEVLLGLYSDTEGFDNTRLGGLEIFEGTTKENLSRDPRASLLFTGDSPSFESYQVDGTVEFVYQGDRYYEYLLAARELFATDAFHIPQAEYPRGYVLKVRGVRCKTPFPKRV